MTEKADGDCFETAGKVVLPEFRCSLLPQDHPANRYLEAAEDVRCCHGMVTRRDGKQHVHAWVEFLFCGEWYVSDLSNGNQFVGLRAWYYTAGKISRAYRYVEDEARECVITTSVWGPWEAEDNMPRVVA